MKTMTSQETGTVSGAKLLAALSYDHRLCGIVIAGQGNWQELLESVGPGQLQRNVASVVWQIREAQGKEADYAREITQGRE